MDPQVIDNFLPEELYYSLKESVNSEDHPWFFVPQISSVDDEDYRSTMDLVVMLLSMNFLSSMKDFLVLL